MTPFVDQFKACYQDFLKVDGHMLGQLYKQEAEFQDPVHRVCGLAQIAEYYERSKQGLLKAEFEFVEVCGSAGQLALTWQMHYAHRRIKGGRELVLPGITMLKLQSCAGQDMVIEHVDYYDMGAMVYEHIPILGAGVKFLKAKIAG